MKQYKDYDTMILQDYDTVFFTLTALLGTD